MTAQAYILVIYLMSSSATVVEVPDVTVCVQQSLVQMRRDDVRGTYCTPSDGVRA